MDLGLTDKVFVVTAASGGLGRATADQLVAEGARVVLVARRAEQLDAAVADLGGHAHAVALAADLSDPDTATAAADLALSSFGRLDGALISVGGPPPGAVLGNTDEQWLAHARATGSTTYHPVGTAKIGTDARPLDRPGVDWPALFTALRAEISALERAVDVRPSLPVLLQTP